MQLGKVLALLFFVTLSQTARSQDLYLGLWRSGNDGYALWSGVGWDNFVAEWEAYGRQGLRLIDIETYADGRERKFTGVWREGTGGHYLWVGVEWEAFVSKWKELGRQNLRLIDIETYVGEDGQRRYIGVWREGTDGYYLWAGTDWKSFTDKWKELGKQNLRLIDIETSTENGQRKYTGVWREGSDKHYIWAGVDWQNFASKWAELAERGYRLVDIETYPGACESECLNQALMADNPDTDKRDTYNYPVKGNDLHCEDDPTNCAGNTDDVYYRWPAVQYGDEFYLRTSVLYDAKDKIFTLPFSDPPADMRKNSWLYGPGNWHHAIDYARKDGQPFVVRAAAPGRVIHVGWDDWSGGTVVMSHDAGGKKDVYRTIYMHLMNGANRDCDSAWMATIPTLDSVETINYTSYLESTGCYEDPADRELSVDHWGIDGTTMNASALGTTVPAGNVLGIAGSTGPGGCGCMNGGGGPNHHLHLFFAHRDPANDKWYLFDPYGIYSFPDCYPTEVDGAINTACSRYPVSWKGGSPRYFDKSPTISIPAPSRDTVAPGVFPRSGDPSIFPNPNNGTFTVVLPAGVADREAATLSLQSLTGRLVFRTTVHGNRYTRREPVAPGIYFLTVEAGGRRWVQRVSIP